MLDQGYINHIALVLDASYSMEPLKKKVVEVADNQIEYLAKRSEELNQETRITVYTFGGRGVECVIYDKDVLRLPTIQKYYKPYGNTPLIDAAIKSQQDLSHTPELYGDHAFLTYVLTDGQENASSKRPSTLAKMLNELPGHWTLAVMVPNKSGVQDARYYGFPEGNISVWDTTSTAGLEKAGAVIRKTTDNFMTQRSSGVRGSRSLFDMSAASLNRSTVKGALKELPKNSYLLADVTAHDSTAIREFVWSKGIHYNLGIAYYQLSKAENIQPQKQICVLDKKTKKVYSGQEARDILGLPDATIRVHPTHNPDYDVFVQSTSVNRKLVPGTKVLVMQ